MHHPTEQKTKSLDRFLAKQPKICFCIFSEDVLYISHVVIYAKIRQSDKFPEVLEEKRR